MSGRHLSGRVRHALAGLGVLVSLTGVPAIASVAFAAPTQASTSVGGNDYPWSGAVACPDYGQYSWCENGNDISPLGFGYRNCTDYAAYELNEQMGGTVSDPKFSYSAFGFNNGNAVGWKTAITNKLGGAAANSTPAVGSVAWYDSSWGDGYGHVAIVASILYNPDGSVNSITVDDYNYRGTGTYDSYTISSGASDWPDSFLHVADISPGGDSPSGTLWGVNTTGQAIRYAGSGRWTYQGGPAFRGIASDSDGSTVAAVSTSGGVYTYTGNNTWHQVSGATLTDVADQAGTLWGVNTTGQAIRYAGSGHWTYQGGPAFIEIAASGSAVAAVSTSGGVYTYTGDNTWHQVSGATLTDVAVQ